MAIKVAVHRVCDRCQQPFDESSLKYGDELPKFQTKSLAAALHDGPKGTGTSKVLFSFEDLCPDCDRVVDGYIRKIRMEEVTDEPSAAKPGKKTKKNEKTPEVSTVTAPPDPEKNITKEPEKSVAKAESVETPPPATESKELPSVATNGAATASATENASHPF